MNIRDFCLHIETICNNIISDAFDPESDYTVEELCLLLQALKLNDDALTRESATPLLDFLEIRWERIKNTDFAYPHAPKSRANRVCLALAHALETLYDKSRYQLLMPTITVAFNDLSATSLREPTLKLKDFVLSDSNNCIIEVLPCLDFATEDGKLKHLSLHNGEVKILSASEQKRLVSHSTLTRDYYATIMRRFKVKTRGNSIGAELNRLKCALRAGGAHSGHDGSEYDSGRNANIGIQEFSEFLDSLTPSERDTLFACSAPGVNAFGTVWDRLARPTEVNYRQTVFCVELLSDAIELILTHNRRLYDTYPASAISRIKVNVEKLEIALAEKKKILSEAIQRHDYVVVSSYGNKTGQELLATFLGRHINNADEMRFAFSCVSENHYLILLRLAGMHYVPVNGEELIKMLNILPELERWTFLMQHRDKLPDILTNTYFYQVYKRLPEPAQASLLRQFKHLLIARAATSNELYDALFYIPPAERMALIYEHALHLGMLVDNTGALISLLSLIPTEEKINFISLLRPTLNTIIPTGTQLGAVLRHLSPQHQGALLDFTAEDFPNKIKTFIEFWGFYMAADIIHRQDIIQYFDRYLFDLIRDGNQLATLLSGIEKVNRGAFLYSIGRDLKKIIQIGPQLAMCLALLNERDQVMLLDILGSELKDILFDGDEVKRISVLLPSTVKHAVTKHTHKDIPILSGIASFFGGLFSRAPTKDQPSNAPVLKPH